MLSLAALLLGTFARRTLMTLLHPLGTTPTEVAAGRAFLARMNTVFSSAAHVFTVRLTCTPLTARSLAFRALRAVCTTVFGGELALLAPFASLRPGISAFSWRTLGFGASVLGSTASAIGSLADRAILATRLGLNPVLVIVLTLLTACATGRARTIRTL